jgi:hypothetical protein
LQSEAGERRIWEGLVFEGSLRGSLRHAAWRAAGSRARRESGLPENAEGSGVRRRSRENGNDLNPIPGATLHNMIVEGLSMPAALKEKLKPILAPKG